ncbi:MAG: hypothetical protein HY399_08785 [Elusimicrobia bacterium]|nr:hypothetical protein [Elusimicrobiota bacterium]
MLNTLNISTGTKLKAKLGLRLKALQVFTLSEPDLAKFVVQLENDPLFDRIRPFITRMPFTTSRLLLLPEKEVQSISERPDVRWSEFEDELGLISKMGQQAFERYFLVEDTVLSQEETAARCGISQGDAKRIRDFLLILSLQSHESLSPITPLSYRKSDTCIAKVELYDGEPQIIWTFLHLARGRYGINYEKIREVMKSLDNAAEKKQLRQLLDALDLVNLRQDTLWRALQVLLNRQKRYFTTHRIDTLKPLPPVALARFLSVHPSTVGRLLNNRNLLTPWNEEIPCRLLAPNQRKIAVAAIDRFLRLPPSRQWTDEELRFQLHKTRGICLSRRSVNECRREAML